MIVSKQTPRVVSCLQAVMAVAHYLLPNAVLMDCTVARMAPNVMTKRAHVMHRQSNRSASIDIMVSNMITCVRTRTRPVMTTRPVVSKRVVGMAVVHTKQVFVVLMASTVVLTGLNAISFISNVFDSHIILLNSIVFIVMKE